MTVLALDPGIRGCGVALFVDGRLFSADYVKNPARRGNRAAECVAMARAVWHWTDDDVDALVVEWPQIYASRIMRGENGDKDPNDLLALCGIDAAVATFLRVEAEALTTYLPREWKGTMKKGPCHERARDRLGETELQRALGGAARAGADLAHNMWDAVALGLHHLGRLAPKRVIAS